MDDYWLENEFWIPPVLDLILRPVFQQVTPYRNLLGRHLPRLSDTGLDYECLRMWRLGRSIIEHGYRRTCPIVYTIADGKTILRDGWHRARVLRALGMPVPAVEGRKQ